MSVEGVNNNNSNAALYGVGGAVLGAGTGAGVAYLTKPFFKDGAPTDSFIKKMGEKIKESQPQEIRELTEALENEVNKNMKRFNEANTVEEIRNVFMEVTTSGVTEKTLQENREMQAGMVEQLRALGADVKPELIEEYKNINSVEELKAFMGKMFDNAYAGKNADEIKQMFKAEMESNERNVATTLFNQYFDAGKKEFVNCEDGVGAAIKKAARSIQGKYAMIYGGIAAAVLGLGAYLFANSLKPAEAPQEKIDTQV